MNLEALFNAVIVKPLEIEETKYGSIVVPDIGKDRNEHGTIVAIGPGQHTISGTFIPTISNIGDVVVLPTQGFTKLEHDGEDYYVGPENQILAKVKKEVNIEDILAETEVTKEEEAYINDIKIKE
jgi:co-chaperonin GroES (HSP10)|tara:strand:+ start:47 stop:421 length:375 start_codon:yes stop_codon:yes gene_type:complete